MVHGSEFANNPRTTILKILGKLKPDQGLSARCFSTLDKAFFAFRYELFTSQKNAIKENKNIPSQLKNKTKKICKNRSMVYKTKVVNNTISICRNREQANSSALN